MNEREKLIEELRKQHWSSDSTIGYDYSEEIATFIISDRERIVESLSIAMNEACNTTDDVRVLKLFTDAINETLKLAGV